MSWKQIDVLDGALVLAPADTKTRIKNFGHRVKRGDRAFAEDGKIYVRSAQVWHSDPGLQIHELTHIHQERLLPDNHGELYAMFEPLGYWLNPFEIHAMAKQGWVYFLMALRWPLTRLAKAWRQWR